MSRLARARLQLLAAALLFSTGGAAIKAITLTAWQVACFRSGIAGLFLAVLMPNWRRNMGLRTWMVGSIFSLTMILFVLGNKLTTAANTIFLQSTAPLYLLFLGPRLLGERVNLRDVLLTGCLAAGMLLIVLGGEVATVTSPHPLLGNGLAALAGLTWAVTIVGLRWLGRSSPTNPGSPAGGDLNGTAVFCGTLVTLLATLPLALPVHHATTSDWVILGYLGLFQIGLAYVFLTRGLQDVDALEASLLLLIEPVASTLWAWLIHSERPSPLALVGCLVILVSSMLRATGRS